MNTENPDKIEQGDLVQCIIPKMNGNKIRSLGMGWEERKIFRVENTGTIAIREKKGHTAYRTARGQGIRIPSYAIKVIKKHYDTDSFNCSKETLKGDKDMEPEKVIDEIKKGISFKIKPTLEEGEEFFNVEIACLNPAFMDMLKYFSTKTTTEGVISDHVYKRYKIKAVLASGLKEKDTIFFHQELVSKGKVCLKEITHQGLIDIKESFNKANNLLHKMIGILLETKKELNYNYTIEFTKKS